MIIKSKKNIEGLYQHEMKGDNFIFHHAEKIDGALEDAHKEREFGNNGWTNDKGMRKIATVPTLEFYNNPELLKDNSNKTWRKYLMGKGRDFAAVSPATI